MRTTIVALVAAWLLASSVASAQVSVLARLEKTRFAVGEPILVIVDVANTGPAPIAEGMKCSHDLAMSITGRQPRPSPRSVRRGAVEGSCGGSSHPPVIEPGGHRATPYVLRGYDLGAGDYTLRVVGKLRFRHQLGADLSADAPVSSEVAFTVVSTTPGQLREVLRPTIETALAPQSAARFLARDALIEAAPAFLAEELAAFARAGSSGVGEALLRIGTPRSHVLLRELVVNGLPLIPGQLALVEALAHFGDPADVVILQGIADDSRSGEYIRRTARLAIARSGGEQAVDVLVRSRAAAGADDERGIIEALGHTQSRQAVPALIARFRDENSTDVCTSLSMLTHRQWCDFNGVGFDPAATRRRWTRQWQAEGAGMTIYSADTFAEFEAEEERRMSVPIGPAPLVPAPIVRRSTRAPSIHKVTPDHPSPNSPVRLEGYNLGFGAPYNSVVIKFRQGMVEHVAKAGSGGMVIDNGVEGLQHIGAMTPEALTPGRWEIGLEISGRSVATKTVDIVAAPRLRLVAMPAAVHPSDPFVWVETNHPPPANTRLDLVDSTGRIWPLESYPSLSGMTFGIPADASDGIGTLRLRRTDGAVDDGNRGLPVNVTSGPLPLTPTALQLMRAVAPGQRTRLALDTPDELELRRIDAAEIEFEQNGERTLVPLEGLRRRVRLPEQLTPGLATARSRTSIETTVSQWSAPVSIRVSSRPAPASVEQMFSEGHRVWWDRGPGFVYARPGQVFGISGNLPDVAANVRVQLVRGSQTKAVSVADSDDDLRITLPSDLTMGDWRLRIGAISPSTPMRDVTLMRVQ